MRKNRQLLSFLVGFLIATLGGLIGLGGAEFRLPLLVGLFGFSALSAVILNKAISFSVVIFSLLFRFKHIPIDEILGNFWIVINILTGSLIGAYYGANKTLNISEKTLRRVILILLLSLGVMMIVGHDFLSCDHQLFSNKYLLMAAGVIAGFFIGVIAATLGVAGGEFIIPTVVILYGVDIKIAGSLSLTISIPTMTVALIRYFNSPQFDVVKSNREFFYMMVLGSLVGSYTGASFLKYVNSHVISIVLGVILFISAFKVFKGHK